MCYTSLIDFLEGLERLGQLRLVEAEVDPTGVSAGEADALVGDDEKAVLFHNVRGSPTPLTVGLFGTEARITGALAARSLDEVAQRVERLIPALPKTGGCLGQSGAVAQRDGFPGHRSAMARAPAQDDDDQGLARFAPRVVKVGACQKVVRLGEDVDLGQLPVPRDSREQSHPLVTAGQLVSRDPASGRLLVDHAELSVRSGRELAVHWAPHDPLAGLLAAYRGRGEAMPLAVALGGAPAWLLAAMAAPPRPVDRRGLAGLLAGRRLDVVRCRTLDLEVPAEAELVIEGAIDPAAAEVESRSVATPLGHRAASRPAPVVRVDALTHRANPVFPAIVYGRGSREWVAIARAMQKVLLPLLRAVIPELVDCNLPACGHGRELAWVSIRHGEPAAAERVARTLWQLPATRFCKLMVMVNESIDIHDPATVWTAAATRMDPRRDVFFDDGPADPWDPAGDSPCRKMALDATGHD